MIGQTSLLVKVYFLLLLPHVDFETDRGHHKPAKRTVCCGFCQQDNGGRWPPIRDTVILERSNPKHW